MQRTDILAVIRMYNGDFRSDSTALVTFFDNVEGALQKNRVHKFKVSQVYQYNQYLN